MPVMLDAMDNENRMLVWNRECEEVTGYTAKEVIGTSNIMEYLYADDINYSSLMKEWTEHGEDFRNREMEITCNDGTTKIIAWTNISKRFMIPGWKTWSIGIDVTERNRMEKEREKLQVQIQYAQRMESIGTLAGGTAHNFNNLLMGIQGNASLLLLEKDPEDPDCQRLSNIQKLTQDGARLTGQLLGYARP